MLKLLHVLIDFDKIIQLTHLLIDLTIKMGRRCVLNGPKYYAEATQ